MDPTNTPGTNEDVLRTAAQYKAVGAYIRKVRQKLKEVDPDDACNGDNEPESDLEGGGTTRT